MRGCADKMLRMKTMPLTYLIALLAFGPVGCESSDTQQVQIGDRTFTLELALDDATRTQGLMHRESLAEDGGMLFVFPSAAVRGFWMKNCLMDLDIIFLDGMGYVTAVHTMTAPPPGSKGPFPSWSSVTPAQFAIEIQPGLAKQLGVKRGDQIELPLKRLKSRAK